MSQELHVLQCYSCETFQVHIVKKSNKWECKVCGEKQSIKKVFGRGSGKDCRNHVQRLNEEKRKRELSFLNKRLDMQCIENVVKTEASVPSLTESKWQKYLSEEEEGFSDDSVSSATPYRVEEYSDNLTGSFIKGNNSMGCALNQISERKPDLLPKMCARGSVCITETGHNNSEGLKIDTSEKNYAKLPTAEYKTSFSAERFHYFKDRQLSKIYSTDCTQKQPTKLCFNLLPGTSTEEDFLEYNLQQEIQSDLNDFNNEMDIPNLSEESCMNSELNVGFQSNIETNYENTSIIKPKKCSNKVNHIFQDEYNEAELDKILNL